MLAPSLVIVVRQAGKLFTIQVVAILKKILYLAALLFLMLYLKCYNESAKRCIGWSQKRSIFGVDKTKSEMYVLIGHLLAV